jgi:signal transduction histidine kinase
MESFLHRQTESKLIAEAAYIRQIYIEATLSGAVPVETVPLPSQARKEDDFFQPVFARIDMRRDPLLPPSPPAVPPRVPPDPAALDAGRRITPLLLAVQRQNLSGVRVLDVRGTAVAGTGDGIGMSYAPLEEVATALRGDFASTVRRREAAPRHEGRWNRASRVRIHVAMPIIHSDRLLGVVYLNRTSLSLFLDVWEAHYTHAIMLILLITVVIALALSHLLTAPLRSLIAQAATIADQPRAVQIEVARPAPREAHQLADALNRMMEALQRRMTWVSEFTRNVSHEFKTPLAGICGAVEILKSDWKDLTATERNAFIDMIEQDARRMNTLVERLTELTRIENSGTTDSVTDLLPLLRNLRDSFNTRGHSIALKENLTSARVVMAEDLAETLFVNLLDNAVRHGGGKAVRIAIDEGPLVTVSDRGPGISPANLPRVFDRFFTTARDTGGTGLGLSMVQTIAHAHGVVVSMDSSSAGTTVAVRFPDRERKATHDARTDD